MIAESADTQRIDAALLDWRQGDVILGSALHFIHQADLVHPVSDEAAANATAQAVGPAGQENIAILESTFPGFIVVTQTCDVVRGCRERPYVELAPLVEADAAFVAEVKSLRRPSFAYVPTVADRNLVADLDRTMTIEKGLLAGLPRAQGVTTDAEIRAFASALARKRARFAFPDSFTDLMKPLSGLLKKRYGKNNAEGHHVDALQEIRVAARPSWDGNGIALVFWFIKGTEPANPDWSKWVAEWLALVKPTATYTAIEGLTVRLDDMTARDYVESEHLDLDQLSADEGN